MRTSDPADRLASADLTGRDRQRLQRRLRLLGAPGHTADPARLVAEIERAEALVARRRAAVPDVVPTYPPELPVSQHREELLAAIGDHQVVVVAGETGSGKTTQLPKLCLELGRGVRGTIGHTQPRRIAARTVAERIADELHVPLGGAVGYAVRFNDRVGDDTLVKLMTDGILLAELPRDRLLSGYDTIIVDEAHERSLNIDFLLGYLAQLLPQRPDLKVVVTSATIDTARFAAHFGGAPVVEVSGRSYPVEIRYEPVADPEADDVGRRERDQTEAIVDAVRELVAEAPGDVLVFLAGEREIRDTAEALRAAELPGTEILPLYARLSAAEQHRVFRPHAGRRVVLATNVAETSITVPGIRAVVDPGFARISRYSPRTKVQRLPIEPISRASADQRAGRCGRIGPGVCIRLYGEEDYEGRAAFTDPEITRTNLASVILQMAALGLGDVGDFPFLDPPDRRQVNAAVDLLDELGALGGGSGATRLTPIGRRLARLPVDPRLGRMVLEAERNGCVRETIVVAAALSIQDPRERPAEHRQAAEESHRRFAVPGSDLLGYLRLWEYLQERQRELSSSAFRRLCRREYLNFQRVREWEDLCTQLRQVCRDLGIRLNHEPGPPDAVHRSVLAGLLSHIGVLDEPAGERRRPRPGSGPRQREYQGARHTRFAIGRGSVLAKSPPRWVMAAELVETERLWARNAARIEPQWAERLGAHLLQRSYSEPRWDRQRASTVATLTATLYGVPVVTNRTVDYARLDPELARELFIRHALVWEEWDTHHRFPEDNRRAREAVVAIEERVRRRDLLVDDEALELVYDERVPAGITTGREFDRWWRDARRSEPDRMTL
ncbi:ATP-dependent RNA helicase HrpA, partial [Acidimicrobiaceae bacterium USS-CC1]|nr:ATP-dependent RNA helicase HrpA [Acidiferrimicrobium australe]